MNGSISVGVHLECEFDCKNTFRVSVLIIGHSNKGKIREDS